MKHALEPKCNPDLEPTSDPQLTIHYNGACPICRPEVEQYRRSADRDQVTGLRFADITDPERPTDLTETLRRHGISPDQAARRFTVVVDGEDGGEDGGGASGTGTQVHTGVAGFIVLWSRLPKFRWLAGVVAAPVIRPCAEIVYDRILAPLLYWSNKRAGRLNGLNS
jgi:predicted DCC family thiol-disulfide oxidoreductase YuxK